MPAAIAAERSLGIRPSGSLPRARAMAFADGRQDRTAPAAVIKRCDGHDAGRSRSACFRRDKSGLVLYSPAHIDRLEQLGQFPKRVRLSPHRTGRVGWLEEEILAWIDAKLRQR